MTAQGQARLGLAASALVHRRSVKVVHAMGDGIVHEAVDIVLFVRQAHHAEAEQGYFLARLVLYAVGHLLSLGGCDLAAFTGQHVKRHHCLHSQSRAGAQPQPLQEFPAIHVFFFHISVLLR